MMLSSTIRTLIGGTAPSRRPWGADKAIPPLTVFFLACFGFPMGPGDEACGAGGVVACCGAISEGIGGVGNAGRLGGL